MKNIVQKILNKDPEELNLAEILVNGFTIQLKSGRSSKVSFRKENGDLVELFHELKYSSNIFDNTLSHTVTQEPDIVLRITKNDLKENLQFTYLFDAKYRLVSDDTDNGKDFPPDDAINQMHRYRDAIYYQDNYQNCKPKKEVIGAFVLFPGTDNVNEVENLYFHKSIEKVNVGAFPLVPGAKIIVNNMILQEFLRNILEVKESTNILNEDVLPYKSMNYEDPDAFVLLGFTTGINQREYFQSGKANIYHIPVHRNGRLNRIRHLHKFKYFCPILNGVSEYYEIVDIKVMARNEIFELGHSLFKNSKETYYVLNISNRKSLKKTISSAVGGHRGFRYAKFSELQSCKTINDFREMFQENH